MRYLSSPPPRIYYHPLVHSFSFTEYFRNVVVFSFEEQLTRSQTHAYTLFYTYTSSMDKGEGQAKARAEERGRMGGAGAGDDLKIILNHNRYISTQLRYTILK